MGHRDATSRYDQDQDDDNDGVMDVDDAFPLIPTESVDSDGDGIGDNTDVDDDGDGWSDYDEAQCNSDPLVRTDTPADDDSDGTCNLMESSTSFENYALTVVVLVLMIAAGMAISARMGQKSFAPPCLPAPATPARGRRFGLNSSGNYTPHRLCVNPIPHASMNRVAWAFLTIIILSSQAAASVVSNQPDWDGAQGLTGWWEDVVNDVLIDESTGDIFVWDISI